MNEDVLAWLLDGDPAVRWRVLRDFTGAGDGVVARERERVASEGWGARLLAEQHEDGGWGEGVYSPKWTSTTYTLLHLLWLGLPAKHAAVLRGCERLWEWQKGWRAPETCVAGILVRLTSAFRYDAERLDGLVEHLVGEQLDDGGWNCKSRGDKGMHGSFHTSIQALEALDAYRRAGQGGEGGSAGDDGAGDCGGRDGDGQVEVGAAIGRGREFFLRHRLYQSHRTGAVAIPASTKFPAFPEWHFDVLRGAGAFRACRGTEGRPSGGRDRAGQGRATAGWTLVDIHRVRGEAVLPPGRAGGEPIEHRAGNARFAMVGGLVAVATVGYS